MECCHYDEGYDDGYEEGSKGSGDLSASLELFEALARRMPEHAESLRAVAAQIASWDLEKIVEKERERVVEITKLYAEAKAA